MNWENTASGALGCTALHVRGTGDISTAGERAPERGLLSFEGRHVAMQGGRKSSDGQGAAVGGVALAAAQAIAAGKKVTLSCILTFSRLCIACCPTCGLRMLTLANRMTRASTVHGMLQYVTHE